MVQRRTLRVKGREYTFRMSRCGTEDGFCSYADASIVVDPNALDVGMTLGHELGHALLWECGHRQHDEATVAAVAEGLVDLLRRHSWLRRMVLDNK